MNGDMLVDQEDDSEETEDAIEGDQSTPTMEDGFEKSFLPNGESSNSIAYSGVSSQEDIGQMVKLYNTGENNCFLKNGGFPVPVELIANEAISGSDMITRGRLNNVPGKHIQDMLTLNEDIEKLTTGQLPSLLPAEQIHDIKDVALIEQGTSRTQEQFEMFTAEQQNKSLKPAERVAKSEPAENNAKFLSTEQIQKMILAKQKKDLLIANKLQESLTEEYPRFLIPPEQSQRPSPIGQNSDMLQDKTIQGVPGNKVEEKDVFKKNLDLDKKLDCKKENVESEYTEEKVLVEKVLEQKGHSSPANDYPFSCRLCDFKTRYELSLNRHVRLKHERHNLQVLRCDYCKFGSPDKYSLKRHYRLVHLEDFDQSNPKMPKCDMCQEPSLNEDELVRHKKTAHNFTVVDYKCGNCSFVSQRHDCLNKHQRTIHRNMEYNCCWKCTQSFYKKIDFKEHVCPAEELSVKCHICSKMLSSPKCLQAHNRLHYGLQKYRCDICQDSFLKRFQLLRHINIKHDDNTMRYACEKCPLSFLYKASLARHVRAVHEDKQEDHTMSYNCELCTSTFLHKANLARHVKAAHADQTPNYIDHKKNNKQLVSAKNDQHTENESKNFVCPECTSCFVFKGGLIRHIQKKHPESISADGTMEGMKV